MTDITELAQSLKAAAENAIGAHERLAAYPYGEIIDISQHEGEQIDIDITDLNEFNKEANPVNILALVEALEKAQTKADVYDMLRDDYGLREKGVGLADFVDWQANRIAELESRTVTVKLPEPPGPMSVGARTVYFGIVADVVSAFQYGLTAAGIKVEVE
ncbi:TPA: ead/Ea22-like family protein [Klebsiella pneumoniae]